MECYASKGLVDFFSINIAEINKQSQTCLSSCGRLRISKPLLTSCLRVKAEVGIHIRKILRKKRKHAFDLEKSKIKKNTKKSTFDLERKQILRPYFFLLLIPTSDVIVKEQKIPILRGKVSSINDDFLCQRWMI